MTFQIENDTVSQIYGIAIIAIARQAAAIEVQCNIITNHAGGEYPPSRYVPPKKLMRNVEKLQYLAAQMVRLANEAATGWNPVETIESAWIKTLPEGHPDRK